MRWTALLLSLALAAASAQALGADAQPTERDSIAAARAVKLSEKLRCLVCQNQSIADSNAELAQDLRSQIREQIGAGKTDDEIVAYMVARYGDFVLYEPPLKTSTALLWAGPALLVLGGFVGLARFLTARRATVPVPPLSPEEREHAERLLAGGSEDKPA